MDIRQFFFSISDSTFLQSSINLTPSSELLSSEQSTSLHSIAEKSTNISFNISTLHQPCTDVIPIQELSNKKLRFQSNWFKRFLWLHYACELKGVLCFHCANAHNSDLLKLASKTEDVFISIGFRNWKKAIEKFEKHEKSHTHALALHQLQQKKTKPITAQISDKKLMEQADNRKSLLAIFSSLRYLARQGLALRGHEQDEGNFQHLLEMRSFDIPVLFLL